MVGVNKAKQQLSFNGFLSLSWVQAFDWAKADQHNYYIAFYRHMLSITCHVFLFLMICTMLNSSEIGV